MRPKNCGGRNVSSEANQLGQLMDLPLNEALMWLLGGGGGIVTGGLLYRLFGSRTADPPHDTDKAQETLTGMVRTLSEIRDNLQQFCVGVKADHQYQAEATRMQTEALQRLAELLARIDARLTGRP